MGSVSAGFSSSSIRRRASRICWSIDRASPHAEERIRELAGDYERTFRFYNPADPEFTNRLRKVATEAALRAMTLAAPRRCYRICAPFRST